MKCAAPVHLLELLLADLFPGIVPHHVHEVLGGGHFGGAEEAHGVLVELHTGQGWEERMGERWWD